MESTPGSFSKNCYDKANEAFTNDNYQKAIELYSDALSHDPCNVDYLCSRAHAYIKNKILHLQGYVGSINAKKYIKSKIEGGIESVGIGNKLANIFIKQGAHEILRERSK